MREFLEKEFSQIYIFDLGGNIRKRASQPVHNVFNIRVGVSVNIFVRKKWSDVL